MELVLGHIDKSGFKVFAGRSQPIVDRLARQIEEAGDFGVRVAADIEQDRHQTLFVRQSRERPVHLAAAVDIVEYGSGGGRRIDELDRVGGDHPASQCPRLAAAAHEDQLPEPAGESGGFAEARQLEPGADEGLLGGILGQLEVADYSVCVPDGHVLKAPDQSVECIVISCLCVSYEDGQVVGISGHQRS